MQRTSWTITEPGQTPPRKKAESTDKIPYVALQRANDNMTESQKEGVRVWNLMVKTLRDNGLMEDKQ